MLNLVWFLAVCAAFGLGLFFRHVLNTLEGIKIKLVELEKRGGAPEPPPPPDTGFIEELSPLQFAAMEERERIAKLNEGVDLHL